MDTKNLIVDNTFRFALDVIDYTELLIQDKKYELAKQLFRSGTSIGANVREAQGGESRGDFVHKMKIAYKEAEETEYWLLLCKHSTHYPTNHKLLGELQSIKKILGKIITTSKAKPQITG